jgi:predicted ATPase
MGMLLERGPGPRAREIAGELALHFAAGRDFARATRYHLAAGDHALRQHGYREAAEHLRRALELLAELPDTAQREEQELTLRMMLGSALSATEGHAAPEVERAYARARELCEKVDDAERLFRILPGLGWYYLVRGSLVTARDVGRRLLAMADASGDPSVRLAAHNTLGVAAFYAGDFTDALPHLERGMALYDPDVHRPLDASVLMIDAGLSCAVHGAWTLWALGHPARAARSMREALEQARAADHPFSLAHAYRSAAAFHHCLREPDALREHATRALALSTEHGFGAVAMTARFHLGWLLVEQGREEGLAPMRAWVARCRELRAEAMVPNYFAWLAAAEARVGRPREGVELVAEALDAASRSGNHYWTAELHRLQGTLADSEQLAEASFREAIAVAQRQGAKSFELRAAMDLARLWSRQGKAREAHALLAEVATGSSDGARTADLADAHALLARLAPR